MKPPARFEFAFSETELGESLKKGVGQVEREGRSVSLLLHFEVVEEPADIGEEEVVDLGLLVERGSIFAKGFFKSQCL